MSSPVASPDQGVSAEEGEDQLLTVSKAAELLSLHPHTVRAYAKQGILPVETLPGRHRRFRLADLKEFQRRVLQNGRLGRVAIQATQGSYCPVKSAQHEIDDILAGFALPPDKYVHAIRLLAAASASLGAALGREDVEAARVQVSVAWTMAVQTEMASAHQGETSNAQDLAVTGQALTRSGHSLTHAH